MTCGTGVPLSPETLERVRETVAALGTTLCHVDWRPGKRRGVLALTIDREAGVTLDDCAAVSHAVESLLDALDAAEAGSGLASAYVLEVASPGLDRPLWSLADCRRFVGRRVRAQLHAPIDGRGKLKGTLESVDADALTILDEDAGRLYTVRFGDVKLARLVPEL